MGQIVVPGSPPSLILSAVDRLVASNADGGVSPLASHLVLLGENAGRNLGDVDYVYVIGANSLMGGFADAVGQGTTVYGALNLVSLTNATAPASDGPIEVLGYNIFPTQVNRIGNAVLIGSNVGALMPAAGSEVSDAVLIGPDVVGRQRILNANGGNGFNLSVIIGARAARGGAFATNGAGATLSSSVIIGADAMGSVGFDAAVPGVQASFNVVIGAGAAALAGILQNSVFQNNVLVGSATYNGVRQSTNSVVIGNGITGQPGFGAGTSANVFIGSGVNGGIDDGAGSDTVIGAGANISGCGSGNVVLGAGANSGAQLPGSANHRFLVETTVGAVVRTLLYGLNSDASPGGLVVGHSVTANRDVPGFNILKLINGTKTGVAPVGGGFLFGDAAGLHWVDVANNDFLLNGGGSLGNFTVATLPAAPPQGSRAFATNALAPAFTVAPAGGGAIYTPVYFDGAIWRCG